jgi:cephalosporin-C deacetylase-like acetyl esterase
MRNKRGVSPEPDRPPIPDAFEHDLTLLGRVLPDLGPPEALGTDRLEANAWKRHRAGIERRALSILGPIPACREPPEVRWGAAAHESAHTRREVSFSGEDGEWISAFLLVPDQRQTPAPAMLCPHPTHAKGKRAGAIPGEAGRPGYEYAMELADRGYLTVVWDHFTIPPRGPAGGEYDSRPFEKRHPDRSPLGKQVWDARRALDFLLTLPEVDSERIGSLGHSLGGNTTLYSAAFDPRIRAAVCACGVSTFRSDRTARYNWVREEGNYHYLPRLGPFLEPGKQPPFETHEIAALVAPRPLLVISGYHDEWCPGSAVMGEFAARLHRLYEQLGHSECFAHLHHGEHHDFGATWRRMAYEWLDRWLRPAAACHADSQVEGDGVPGKAR